MLTVQPFVANLFSSWCLGTSRQNLVINDGVQGSCKRGSYIANFALFLTTPEHSVLQGKKIAEPFLSHIHRINEKTTMRLSARFKTYFNFKNVKYTK